MNRYDIIKNRCISAGRGIRNVITDITVSHTLYTQALSLDGAIVCGIRVFWKFVLGGQNKDIVLRLKKFFFVLLQIIRRSVR